MSDRRKLDELTPRQQQVVRLIREGLSDKEIGAKLEIHYEAVGNILQGIYRQTGARNRVSLVAHFYEIRERVS